jgi:sugar/nucleoside kinase (ribokinase family)
VTVAVIGLSGWDTITTPGGETIRRIGGTPIYAARALRAAGADPVVITKGADLPGATLVLPSETAFASILAHSAEGTQQELAAVGEPFTAEETHAHILPLLGETTWVILGGQSSTDFPPEMFAALHGSGLTVCLDGQGLARGPDPGPIALRPFARDALAGVSVLKLSHAEALAACGTTDPDALRSLGVGEVVVTEGAEGATIVTADAVARVQAGDARYEDPTGAGDSWLAVYALERARGRNPAAAGAAAANATDALYGG